MLKKLFNPKVRAALASPLLFVAYGRMENTVAYSVYFFVPVLAFATSDEKRKKQGEAALL